MKKITIVLSMMISLMFLCTGCGKETPDESITTTTTNTTATLITTANTTEPETTTEETTTAASYEFNLNTLNYKTTIFDSGWMPMTDLETNGIVSAEEKTVDGSTTTYKNADGDTFSNQFIIPDSDGTMLKMKTHTIEGLNLTQINSGNVTADEIAQKAIIEYNLPSEYTYSTLVTQDVEIVFPNSYDGMVVITVGASNTIVSMLNK